MEKNKLVSVIMAAYNSEKYIEIAIRSILDQTFKKFELIIVNDGSSDTTETIVKRIQKLDPRIIYIKNDKNLGQSVSRNKAIKIAKGKYIAIADSDDINNKNRIKMEYQYMEQHPKIDVLGTDYYVLNQCTKNKRYSHVPKNNIVNAKPPVHNPTCMIRAKCFKKYGFYDQNFDNAEDTELFYRWYSQGATFNNLKKALYTYRIHGNNISTTKIASQVKLMLKINLIGLLRQKIKYSPKGYLYILEQCLYFCFLSIKTFKK